MSKQTAVEWLVDKLSNYDSKMIELFDKEIEQAKEMDKQNIISAYQQGYNNAYFNDPITGEEYYNENFNKQRS